jgi:hypothetical protein
MGTAAYLPIAADRYTPLVRQLRFRGLDLRGVGMQGQVRLAQDIPGEPLIDFADVEAVGAQGLRVVDFVVVDGVPITTIELAIDEDALRALPYSGEVGDASPLAYDIVAWVGGRKRRLLYGEFVVLPGVTGADSAPYDRPGGWGDRARQWQTWGTTEIRLDGGTTTISLGGIDLIDAVLEQKFLSQRIDFSRIEARGLLYGLPKDADRRLFAAEGEEAAFADDFYRRGFRATKLSQVEGVEVPNGMPPIDGRGLLITGDAAFGLYRPNTGDVTVIVEADMPAFDGSVKVLASYVGSLLTENVNINRNGAGTYTMQVVRTGEETLFVAGPTDPTARRMRVAFSIGANRTRVSFAGGGVLSINAPRPVELLRLWLGRLAVGNGNPLDGYITRHALYFHSVSDETLRQMAGAPVTDDEITTLIDQKITTHDNDDRAHALEVTRRAVELADSKTGLWTVKAADSFAGADGSALGNSEVGGIAWASPAGLVRKGGRIQHPTNGFGGAWLNSGAKDGQVEADLYPGTSEASLYFRLNAATTQWLLLQRSADGGITLNLQFEGQTTRLAPLLALPVVAGERFKVRFVGPRIWVFRVVAGEEALLFDVTESRLMNETIHGVRLNGGGSVDNFRVLGREAI